MTRVLSALILLPIVVGVIWWLPAAATYGLGGIILLLACVEYAALARRLSPALSTVVATTAALVLYAGICLGLPASPLVAAIAISIGLIAVGRGRPDEDVLRLVAVTLFPSIYLGAALGLSVRIRATWGPAALLLPFLVIVVSDSLQYYGGRLFGRRPLAPAISPKKTVEGAVCGLIAGAVAAPLLGRLIFPEFALSWFLLLGLVLVAVGIAGDLFESLLKRSAGVKDSSGLIPGHGGMLDRIDALLFAGPVYYLLLNYASW